MAEEKFFYKHIKKVDERGHVFPGGRLVVKASSDDAANQKIARLVVNWEGEYIYIPRCAQLNGPFATRKEALENDNQNPVIF